MTSTFVNNKGIMIDQQTKSFLSGAEALWVNLQCWQIRFEY